MPITKASYFTTRSQLLRDYTSLIVALEQYYMDVLLNIVMSSIDEIYKDFGLAIELAPFWINYPPLQRGRAPRGTATPWGEVGEKTISSCLIRALSSHIPSITFPGLPLGGHIRFATNAAFVHFDIKLTGPNDNPNEIVASPHQIAGDGRYWQNNGVVNSLVSITGQKAHMDFQPELPPFYVLDNHILVCLTYFLKVVYTVRGPGDQPLDYLELACVPNGLLLFDGPIYAQNRGLLIPGKDEKDHPKKRVRVRLEPLATLAHWRSIQIVLTDNGWQSIPRLSR